MQLLCNRCDTPILKMSNNFIRDTLNIDKTKHIKDLEASPNYTDALGF